jgi:lipid II:glycine glycyltransferase (peptidoglycan interpeptide bridge formation enzyme)
MAPLIDIESKSASKCNEDLMKGDRALVETEQEKANGTEVSASHSLTVQEADLQEWHAFLARTPGGSYQQTSSWAITKWMEGFRSRRFTIKNDGVILGGAQLLYRPLPIHGVLGYVPLGPVLASDDPEVANLAVANLHNLAAEHHISYLAVQAPRWGQAFARKLQSLGFSPAFLDLAPNASVVIDLSDSLDRILSRMRKTTRHEIRASQCRGITIRDGGLKDLDAVHKLLRATAMRQFLPTLEKNYLCEIWQRFSLGGNIRLFIAEFEGRPVSAALTMAFGDTVTYWRNGWSGEQGTRYPNEALQWAAILWAKSQGYRYYDFGGIPRDLAKSGLAGESIRKPGKYAVGFYKLGFGGQIELFPEALLYIYNRTLRRVWSAVSNREQTLLPDILPSLGDLPGIFPGGQFSRPAK